MLAKAVQRLGRNERLARILQKTFTRAQQGSDIAANRLLKMCEPDIVKISSKYAQNPSELQEIVQNVRIYIANLINNKNKAVENFQHYFRKITSCIGKGFRQTQQQYYSKHISLDACDYFTTPSGANKMRTIGSALIDPKQSTPSDVLYAKEVVENIKKLPSKIQQKILETDIGIGETSVIRKNTNELAEHLGIKPNTLTQNRIRAKEKLKQIVEYE